MILRVGAAFRRRARRASMPNPRRSRTSFGRWVASPLLVALLLAVCAPAWGKVSLTVSMCVTAVPSPPVAGGLVVVVLVIPVVVVVGVSRRLHFTRLCLF